MTRWLSHGALGCMELLCLSCPRGILLPPVCVCGAARLNHLKILTSSSSLNIKESQRSEIMLSINYTSHVGVRTRNSGLSNKDIHQAM